ncbi:hypothetical protein EYF80_016294 [Liparis tanakae]|uniref:Uncharacterized protein n=1 Tax=Liparis tanakae TaxID=230148 RepID=A0A4Z2I834_9TELE|nr:hypothetical protein EYF80_016294 [Liparis tanakae]
MPAPMRQSSLMQWASASSSGQENRTKFKAATYSRKSMVLSCVHGERESVNRYVYRGAVWARPLGHVHQQRLHMSRQLAVGMAAF